TGFIPVRQRTIATSAIHSAQQSTHNGQVQAQRLFSSEWSCNPADRAYCQLPGLSYIRLSWFFSMILHVKHIPAKQTPVAANVVSALVTAAGEGQVQPGILENLNVHLDWVQYKTNFREAISLRRAVRGDEVLPGIEVGVDLRQVR